MKYDYQKEFVLHYSEIDSSAHFSLVSILNHIQNMSTEYFQTMKIDNFTLSTQDNAVWVITKTKIQLMKRPVWKDIISIRIYTTKVSAIRYHVEISFEDVDKKCIILAKQEFCAMDIATRRGRKISTIHFPNNLEVEEEKYVAEYRHLKEPFSETEYVYSQKIGSQDIDFSKHTNNVVYVRYIMNLFSCKELEEKEVDEFEIHYFSESKEGQILKIYQKTISENEIEFLMKGEDKEVARSYITFKRRKK